MVQNILTRCSTVVVNLTTCLRAEIEITDLIQAIISPVVRPLMVSYCLIPARCHIWVDGLLLFSLCSEGFSSGSPFVLSPQKTNTPNSNSTRIEEPHESQQRLRVYLLL